MLVDSFFYAHVFHLLDFDMNYVV